MANDLYELLEVNASASQDAIAAGYKRLHAKSAELAAQGDEDATNLLVALREAYGTLSDPERRQRYDARLAARNSEALAPAGRSTSFFKLLLIAAVVGASGVGYAKYQSDQEKLRLESVREAASVKKAELEAQRAREETALAREADEQRRQQEEIERLNRQRDIAYGNQVSKDIQRAEAQARYDKQKEEQRLAQVEREQKYAADRQLAREKAYLRQVEAENSGYRRW